MIAPILLKLAPYAVAGVVGIAIGGGLASRFYESKIDSITEDAASRVAAAEKKVQDTVLAQEKALLDVQRASQEQAAKLTALIGKADRAAAARLADYDARVRANPGPTCTFSPAAMDTLKALSERSDP